ncbi:MAG: hypothetical protein AB7K24_09695 [Gemmataceae bacterium]
MSGFVRVEGKQAGPEAVGVLVPPGRRTMVIVRPRALDWDLLPLGPEQAGKPFPLWEVSHLEAAPLAASICDALESANGLRVEPIGTPLGYQIRASVGRFVLIVCDRVPGQPYQPSHFEKVSRAQEVADLVLASLNPSAASPGQLYLNTQNFQR